jgi:hypothetical protein
MSVLYHGEFPSQQSSGKVSQFKAPLKLQPGAQSGKLPAQGQRYSTLGSTSSKGVSQFKTLPRIQASVQSGKLLAQNRPYSASGGLPSNGAPLFPVTNPAQPVVQQPEKRIGQSGGQTQGRDKPQPLHVPTGMSLPRILALPSVVARDTYPADEPITGESGVLPIYPNTVSTDPYVGIPASLSSLEVLRQRRSSQFLRETDRSWRPALPRTEALRRTKTHVTMKVILMGGTALLVGGMASFLLLRSPTYLVVTWAILIIVFSNLASRELRSYYQRTPTTLGMEAGHPSTISTPHGEDMGRHPVLKDITDTTGYLKALLVCKNDQPAQTFPRAKECKV